MKHRKKTKKKEWAFENTIFLFSSLFLLFLLSDTEIVHGLIRTVSGYGYVGAFLTGIFFVSTFTVAPASVVLFHLSQEYSSLYVALSAGAGAVIGDLLLFRVFKDAIFDELRPVITKLRRRPVFHLFKTPYFAWLTPVIGAVIIASPLPDEVGVGMLGASKVTQWQFIMLTYALNTVGILVIVLLASST